MKRIPLYVLTLLMATALWSCDTENPNSAPPNNQEQPSDPDFEEPDEPTSGVIVKKRVAIMGDSYSAFEGWSNKDVAGNDNGYYVYYPRSNSGVISVEKMWWYMLCQKPEFELEISNSYSGSVISNAFYDGLEVTGTDLTFMNRVGKNSQGVDYNGNPDIILVFGGTNDCWAGVKLGNYIYEGWTDEDLKCFRPAFSKLLSSLLELYPNAKVYNIANSVTNDDAFGLTEPFIESMQRVCDHYGIPNIALKDIAKVDHHPTYAGMQSICKQVYSVLRNHATRSNK